MTAEKIIDKAREYIGVKEVPAGSNKVIFNTVYYNRVVSGSAYPWCCVFVWYVFKECEASDLFYDGQKTAYCPTVAGWAKKNNLTISKTEGRKGDIVLFDWNKDGVADHIGLIEYQNNDGTYITIEGNTSVTSNNNGGEVMRRQRSTSNIYMIVRPKYNEEFSDTIHDSLTAGKDTLTLAKEVIAGKWGSGDERKTRLKNAGYSYEEVQAKVNEIMKASNSASVTPASSVAVVKYMTVTAKSGLNLRREPTKNSKIIGAFKNGARVKIVDKSDADWYKVSGTINGKAVIGYCSSKYLKG